ncbi:MAG: sulfurtransferase [Solirubrobacterales bacterium]|nr:sulfurtransferase [Solirubrobacterales bacterium]
MAAGTSEVDAVAPIVSAGWLAEHRDDVLVADVRWYLDGRSGRDAYAAGHVAGAIFVDLDRALADPPSPERGRHPLPSAQRFAQELGALGIDDAATVVAYDDAGGLSAARLVWMLRRLGQPAALLDGGLQAWAGELERGAPAGALAPASRAPRDWPPSVLAGIDEVATTTAPLLDARAAERYAGEVEPIDPRAGHIPGARSVPFAGSLAQDGRFLDPERLRARFGDEPVIAYCGSGVSACHLLIAHEAAGLGPGRLFPGSWSQWSADPARPIQTGLRRSA